MEPTTTADYAEAQEPYGVHKLISIGLVGLLIGGLVTVAIFKSASDQWEPWNDYGEWRVSSNNRTIETERTLRCADEYRVRIADQPASGPWLLQFERRSNDGFCHLAGCIKAPEETFGCGLKLELPEILPPGVEVRAKCDPIATPYVSASPDQPHITLGAGESVICSAIPSSV